jgi:hypothetical protein
VNRSTEICKLNDRGRESPAVPLQLFTLNSFLVSVGELSLVQHIIRSSAKISRMQRPADVNPPTKLKVGPGVSEWSVA